MPTHHKLGINLLCHIDIGGLVKNRPRISCIIYGISIIIGSLVTAHHISFLTRPDIGWLGIKIIKSY